MKNTTTLIIAILAITAGFLLGHFVPSVISTGRLQMSSIWSLQKPEQAYQACLTEKSNLKQQNQELHWELYGPEEGTVTRILDGDTIDVDGRTVRILGIDTPEKAWGSRAEEPYYQEALDFTTKTLSGATVRLEAGPENLERFCRLLRLVWYQDEHGDWQFFETKVLERGLAEAMLYRKDIPYYQEMIETEAAAKEAGVGIWSLQTQE